MSDYKRSTRECSFGQLRPELLRAIREYIRKNELTNLEAEILMCCETTSEKKKKGLLSSLMGGDPDPVHYTGMLVTPRWLIWARHGAKYGTVVSAARLQEMDVKDFDTRLMADTGLEVFGFVSGSTERVSAFIGLGPETAAQQFRERLKAALAKVKL